MYRTCLQCSHVFHDAHHGDRGRPRHYCRDACRKRANYLRFLDRIRAEAVANFAAAVQSAATPVKIA